MRSGPRRNFQVFSALDFLADEYGLEKTKQVWMDDWDLTKAGKKPKTSGTTKLLFRLMDELGK